MVRKLWTTLVVLALMLQPLPALAAGSFEECAQELSRLGLFRGTDSGFELDRAPSRAEAMVMLIRLLGKESAALSYQPPADSPAHPFDDVPKWADPYVSYAYRNGLTKGLSDDKFGAGETVTTPQYFTFVLRSLGYSDGAGDFAWNTSIEKAYSIGIVTTQDYRQASDEFLRGNLADVSLAALSAKMNGVETTLLDKLVADGAVPREAVAAAGPQARWDGTKLIVPVEVIDSGAGQYGFRLSSLSTTLPEAYYFRPYWYETGVFESMPLSERYMQLALSILPPWATNSKLDWQSFSTRQPKFTREVGIHSYYLLDRDGNLLAHASATLPVIDGDTAVLTFETAIGFDSQALINSYLEQAEALTTQAYQFGNELFVPSTYAYSQMVPGQSEPVVQQADTMVVDRSGLPDFARGFTRYCFIGFYHTSPEALAVGHEAVDSINDIEIHDRLLWERMGWVTARDSFRSGYALQYKEDWGIQLNRWDDWTSRFSLLIVILQDDAGVIRAYTYFTADDLARIAR
jgi:hypothetical protein